MASKAPERAPSVPLYINRNFALLWSGQAISYIGDFVFDTTLVLWIASSLVAGKPWAPLAVSGMLACVLVPSVVGGPIAGVFVDRWDKRRTMLLMDILRAGLIGVLLLFSGAVSLPLLAGGKLPAQGEIAAIYVIVMLATICQQFFGPARMALIGDVAPDGTRERASGLGLVTTSLAAIIGPPLAAPLFFSVGVQWALALNALSFIASAAAILFVRAPPAARSVAVGRRGNARREFIEGIIFFGRSRVLRTVLVAAVLAMAGAGALNALDYFFVVQNLHTSPHLYGWLSAASGFGMIVGAIVCSILAAKFGPTRLFSIGMLAIGFFILIYSRLTSFWPAVVFLGIVGIPIAGANVAVMPIVLAVTPREMIGRITSVLQPAISLASITSIVFSGIIVSTVLNGFHASALGATFGPVDTVFVGGALLALAGGVFALWNLHGVSLDTSASTETQPIINPEPESALVS